MPRIELLDPTQNGRPAEHLENKLATSSLDKTKQFTRS